MAHLHEKIDYAADTYVVNEGAVLLRLHDKYKIWLSPGGHIELDEPQYEIKDRIKRYARAALDAAEKELKK